MSAPTPATTERPSTAVMVPLLLTAALLWHWMNTGVNVGGPDGPAGGNLASAVYALRAALDGAAPYSDGALQAIARADGMHMRVPRPFGPPTSWLVTGWALPMHLADAWTTWVVVQEAFFLAGIGLLAWSWRRLSIATTLALCGATAVMSGVAVALDEAHPVLLMLSLAIGALGLRGRLGGGVLLGLAACLSLRAWLLAPLWLAQRRFAGLAAAVATFAVVSALSILWVGPNPHLVFWTEVVPAMWQCDFTGLGLRIDAFGNAAPARLWAILLPNQGQSLSTGAAVLTWGLGLIVTGGLAARHRIPTEDDWAFAARTSVWLGLVALLPVFGLERMTPWALPAIALSIGAIATGRLSGRWAIPVGVATAVLCYPLLPLRQLWQLLLEPELPGLAVVLREAKLASWLVVLAAAALLSRGRDTE